MQTQKLDLLGVGIGPFNLSLAALLKKTSASHLFLDKSSQFAWHPEMMFADSIMQTSYLKDLVTPVDPTSPYSFLNYLVSEGLFYPFMNTNRSVVSRREFEAYCRWVSERMPERLRFGVDVGQVDFDGEHFVARTSEGEFRSKNLSVATGLTPRIPDCARPLIGPRIFHSKSPHLKNTDLAGKRVFIVGGGQTGIEVFRNALQNRWGKAASIQLITRRKNLEPLDESAFTNEYFTPNYVGTFWNLPGAKKTRIVAEQKLASDGNTPSYLADLYRELYQLKHVEKDPREISLFACRKLQSVKEENGFTLKVENTFRDTVEEYKADIVVLCTGFQSLLPNVLEPLAGRLAIDSEGRLQCGRSYAVEWDGPRENRIYALNFSRHRHGIVDPQTSLMAWRSATVVNDLVGKPVYQTSQPLPNFVNY